MRSPFSLSLVAVIVTAGGLVSCRAAAPRRAAAGKPESAVAGARAHHGIASIYTDRRTASGERFSSSALTAAHKTLPLGSRARVTHLGNGRSVVVRINDRGPYVKGRVIDLTPAAAAQIGFSRRQGLARVKVERIDG